MKLSTIKYLAIIAAGLSLHSCLDLEPQDQLGGDKMWTSASDFRNFSNMFYGWTTDFSSVYNDGSYHSDSRSDLITYTSPNLTSKGTNSIPSSDGFYTDCYKKIRRTNLLLQNAASYLRPDDIKTYVGEACFFRAYTYLDLLQVYGNVIITTGPLDIDDPKMKVGRDDRSKVADLIIADLEKAADMLPAYNEVGTGRVSREAAWALLSRAALYEGTWQKFHNKDTERAAKLLDIAAGAARKVMDSRTFTLFGTDDKTKVLGDSAQKYMFILENEKSNPAGITKADNHEYILARCHDQTLYPINRNITKECVANVQYVTRNFANLYLCSDGLPVEKSKVFKGYGTMTSEWENRDNRMRYNLLKPGTFYWTNTTPHVTWNWMEDSKMDDKGKRPGTILYTGGGGSGYANQKWGSERSVTDSNEGYDYPVIRYAEVLLNYAEAVFERDNKISNSDLDISLNLVRNRVNKEMPKLSNELVSENGLDMETEIRRERTIELYQEGFRLDDLKRWGIAVQTMNKPLLGIKYTGTEYEQTWAGNNAPTYARDADGCLILDNGRKWTDKNYLFPLPYDQLQLNPNLKQNPGWD